MNTRGILLGALLVCAAGSSLSATAAEIHSFTNINKLVPDGNLAGLSDTRSVTSTVAQVTSLRVRLQIAGEFNGDLYGYVRHIGGGRTNFCILLNRPGRTAADAAGYADSGMDVVFDDAAPNGDIHLYRTVATPAAGTPLTGIWQPDGRKVDPTSVSDASPRTTTLGSFAGADANGEWTVYLVDAESGGTNLLQSWGLEIGGATVPPVTWPAPADIVYGTPLDATQLNASSSVPGNFSYTPPLGTVLNAGAGQTLSVSFTPQDGTSYVAVTTNVSLTVLRKALTISADNTNKIYGASVPVCTASYSGFVNGDTSASLDTPVTLTTTATTGCSAGGYPITAAGAADANYTITFLDGTLQVAPAPLTITAESKTKLYGAGIPPLTAACTGFVNGDTVASLDTPVSLATTATAASPVGTYPITASGASDLNYAITFAAGTFQVTPASLTITADNKSKVYGEALPTFTATYTGFVNGDSAASLDTPVTLGTAASPMSDVGAYPITAGGATCVNYAITFVTGSLTITPASTAGTLVTSSSPALPATPVTFTYTVGVPPPGAGVPAGAVQFRLDGSVAVTVPLSAGVAAYTTSTLTVGLHTVTAEYAGSLNFQGTTNHLAPDQLINTPPVAGADTIERWPTNGTKVAITTLLANDLDADGDLVTWVSFSPTSVNGGTVTESNGWLNYEPASGFTNTDSFSYTISDGRGAPVTGTVTVAIKADLVPSPNLAIVNLGNGSYRIWFNGVPNKTYRIQYSDLVEPTNWRDLGSATAGDSGLFEYLDSPSAGAPTRFYRSIYP